MFKNESLKIIFNFFKMESKTKLDYIKWKYNKVGNPYTLIFINCPHIKNFQNALHYYPKDNINVDVDFLYLVREQLEEHKRRRGYIDWWDLAKSPLLEPEKCETHPYLKGISTLIGNPNFNEKHLTSSFKISHLEWSLINEIPTLSLKFIKENIKNIDFYTLCRHIYITDRFLDFLSSKKDKKRKGYFRSLSSNKSLNISHIKRMPKEDWYWPNISTVDNKISCRDIQDNLNFPWDWDHVFCRTNLTSDFIKRFIHLVPDNNYFWSKLSENKNITLEILQLHSDKDWCWFSLSINIKLSVQLLEHFKDKFHFDQVSINTSISLEILENTLHLPWHFGNLSGNTGFTEDIFERFANDQFYSERLDWSALSVNPNITPEIIERHMDKPWKWSDFMFNPNIDYKFINKHKKKNFPNSVKKLSTNKFLFDETVFSNSFKKDCEIMRNAFQSINVYIPQLSSIILYYIGYA